MEWDEPQKKMTLSAQGSIGGELIFVLEKVNDVVHKLLNCNAEWFC